MEPAKSAVLKGSHLVGAKAACRLGQTPEKLQEGSRRDGLGQAFQTLLPQLQQPHSHGHFSVFR